MGEGQGFLADMPPADILSVVKRATFFRQIYAIFEAKNKEQIVTLLKKIGISIRSEQLTNIKIDFNPYTQIFLKYVSEQKIIIVTARFLPFHTLFEYVTEVKKLPAVVFRPKNR
jgi:hypothetical protein